MADRPSQEGIAGRAHALRPSQRRPFPRLQIGLDILLVCTAVLSLLSLLLEHGYYPNQRLLPRTVLHAMQVLAAGLFAADRLVRLLLESDRWGYIKHHWADFVLLALAVLAIALAQPIGLDRLNGRPWLLVVQIYLVGSLAVRGIELNVRAAGSGIHPTRLLVGSFLFLILLGTGLLLLPRAVPQGRPLKFEDALFTSTSATCVTGLVVKDTGGDFTRFGQTVILCLIQLGGLGIMIFGTIFALFAGRRLGLRGAAAMSEMIGQESVGLISRMVGFIVLSTLLIEAVGAALLMPLWPGRPDQGFYAVFHSVSAFCNAGFALHSDSFIGMRETWQVLGVVPVLIILGGLGFPVLYDLTSNLPTACRFLWRSRRRNPGVPRPRLSLHTKVVLVSTLCLIVAGALGLLLVEPAHSRGPQVEQQQGNIPLSEWQAMNWPNRVGQAWFQSVTARTAGFNTVQIGKLSPASQLWIVILMVIGGSPASTAGGMKTVTFWVLLLLVWSVLRRRQSVEMFGRSLAVDLVRRALTLAVLFVVLVTLTTLLLCVAQQGRQGSFMDMFFEAASACGTVGLSTGQTAHLSDYFGKFVIVGAMFVGRIGPLTLLMGLLVGRKPARYSYPNEGVVIG